MTKQSGDREREREERRERKTGVEQKKCMK